MNNEDAIAILENLKTQGECFFSRRLALDLAIKALDLVEQLENMRDNAYRLYNVEKGDGDYSYGRKQVLGTVHSDLEELLEVFKEAENEDN
jgi:hypothetical protein